MKHYCQIIGIAILFCCSVSTFAQFDQPFKWAAKNDGSILTVSVVVPPDHYLYADHRTIVNVSGPDGKLKPESSPKLVDHTDDFGSGDVIPAGKQLWKFNIQPEVSYKVHIEFQGCKENSKDSPGICFMPSEKDFSINVQIGDKTSALLPKTPALNVSKDKLDSILDQFDVLNSGGGYLNKKEFLAFLEKDQTFAEQEEKAPFADMGMFGMIFLVLIGGLALNLTPCVLPMIPINLAIIGAGEGNANKSQGLFRGGIYGLGIACAYGLLGVITVLSGAKFGTLNSSSLFNFIIALVFVVLALAMFDIFSIDLTRFSAKLGMKKPGQGALIPIFIMGVVAALLAGACVAPVVIAVLLHSTTLYSEGNITGLMLPFVLGIGMALPWPFAGAGIALLPKPGRWMIRVKQLMGVLILVFSAYYVYLGVTLLPDDKTDGAGNSFTELKKGLLLAKLENRPVFIDFWASWCKNCSQMEQTTFKDPEVIQKLQPYVFIKFQAERPSQPDIKKLLDRYRLIGLPGYVILKPKQK